MENLVNLENTGLELLISKNNFKHRNIFKDIKLFKNTKYLWGGKSYKGIDCSEFSSIIFKS